MMKRYIVLVFSLLLASVAGAFDFSVAVPSGQTLYFSYVQGGVQAVYPNANAAPTMGWEGYAKPTGAMTIPATVMHGDTTYAVLSVGNFAFHDCGGLTSLILSEGITSVGNSAFRQCSGLSTVTLPASLATWGNLVFAYCYGLTDLWMLRQVPPTVGNNVFYDLTLTGSTLHVPCNALAAYNGVAPWSDFGTIENAGCSVTVTVVSNDVSRGSVTGGGVYPAGTVVMLTAQPANGCFFVCWNDGDTLNPRLFNAYGDTTFTAMFFPSRTDTVTTVVTVHDTTFVHDTVNMVVFVHDTAYVRDTVYLSEPVHDTMFVHDTTVMQPTFFTLTVQSDNTALGVGVGSAVLPAGTQAEVCGLPIAGARFMGWNDGVTDNPRQVTVTGNMTLKALFEPLAVNEVDPMGWTMLVAGRDVTVGGATGQWVRVYDAVGRCLFQATATNDAMVLRMPTAGLYLVRVGDGPARQIVTE